MDHGSFVIDSPERAPIPLHAAADGLQQVWGGSGKRVGFGQDARDGVLRRKPLFGALALENLRSQLFVDGGQLAGPFRHPLLEDFCSPPLLA
jgi:hypothetical protein